MNDQIKLQTSELRVSRVEQLQAFIFSLWFVSCFRFFLYKNKFVEIIVAIVSSLKGLFNSDVIATIFCVFQIISVYEVLTE